MRLTAAGTLRRRIELLLLVTLVPVFVLILANAYTSSQRERLEIQAQAHRTATSVAVNQEQLFVGTGRLFDLLSALGADRETLCSQITSAPAAHPDILNLAVVEGAGAIACQTSAAPAANASLVGAAWFAAARHSSELVVSGLQTSGLASAPSVVVAKRHRSLADVLLVAALGLESLTARMEALPLPPQSAITLVGPDQIVIARVPGNAAWRGRPAAATILEHVKGRDDGYFEADGPDGVRRLYGFRRMDLPDRPLLVTVGIPVAVAYSEVNRRLSTSLGVLAVVTIAAFVFARRFSGSLFERKIESVLRAARNLSAGDLTARTGEAWTPDEVGELARTFDAMAAALQQRTVELEGSVDSLRALTARLETIREEERTRISREIHDELGQALTGIRMDMDRLEARLRDARLTPDAAAPIVAKLASARTLVDAASESARRISRQLRPSVLDVLGFRAAVEWQLDEFRARTGVDIELLAPDPLPALDEQRAVALFRILQETLTNVMRHAQASQVTVRVAHEDGAIVLEVMDNGQGFDVDSRSAAGRLGLLGMRERATSLGGAIEIVSAPGRGTTVRVQLPLAAKGTAS